MIIVKNSLLAKMIRVKGIVLFPFIFFADKNPNQILINHEMIHLQQIRRDGLFKFYFNYLKNYSINRLNKMSHFEAYRSISYEVEAFENQNEIQKELNERPHSKLS